jgi:hypothetical protein
MQLRSSLSQPGRRCHNNQECLRVWLQTTLHMFQSQAIQCQRRNFYLLRATQFLNLTSSSQMQCGLETTRMVRITYTWLGAPSKQDLVRLWEEKATMKATETLFCKVMSKKAAEFTFRSRISIIRINRSFIMDSLSPNLSRVAKKSKAPGC